MEKSCENTFKMIQKKAGELANVVEMRIEFGPLIEAKVTQSKELNTPAWVWEILQPQEIRANLEKSMLFSEINENIGTNLLSSFSQVKSSNAAFYYDSLLRFSDSPATFFYRNWYKARSLIFSLQFDESEKEQETIKEILSLYKEAFDNYKYLAGRNIAEFLADAISADVYFNRKNIKDIIDNTQDDTGESSILKSGKSYWEFGYAVGLLPENSEKTYLAAFNAEKNFWESFPAPKFEHREQALARAESDIADEELNILNLVDEFSDEKKVDDLLSKERKNIRVKLGKRYYSNLSIAILKAETEEDFTFIRNYINSVPAEKLIKNDENGASPLVRALNEYKNCVYGFSKEYRKSRAKILFDYRKESDTYYKYIEGKFSDTYSNDRNLLEYLSEILENDENQFLENYAANFSSYSRICTKTVLADLKKKADLFKSNVIIPLIKKIGESEYANSLLDEAIELDTNRCVSALQLAIECFDFEIADLLVCNFPKGKQNLAKIYISDEYTTPLQYAIRKYDLLMQCWDRYRRRDFLEPLERHEITHRKNVNGGILLEDRALHDKRESVKFRILGLFSFEECGIVYSPIPKKEGKNDNMVLFQQKNLRKIIMEVLAENTNPISVDNFYYLVEQSQNEFVPYGDVLDLTRDLIATGKAELSGIDEEGMSKNILPEETLLARCIRLRSYGMLRMFLTDYPEKFKDIINQRVMGTGSSPDDVRIETDVHMFVLNQIESTKAWLDPNYSTPTYSPNKLLRKKKIRKQYGKMIAVKLNLFLTLFKNAGADFTIKDQAGRSVKDLLMDWKDKFPEGSIPEGIL